MIQWNSLITEENNKASKGKIAFWICFIIACGYWIFFPTLFPNSLVEFLGITFLYEGYKKGVDSFEKLKNLKT